MTSDPLSLTVDADGCPTLLIDGHDGPAEYRVVAVKRWDDQGGRRVRVERDDDEGEVIGYSVGVWPDERRWECTCADALYRRAQRRVGCKHVVACRRYLRVLDAMTGR